MVILAELEVAQWRHNETLSAGVESCNMWKIVENMLKLSCLQMFHYAVFDTTRRMLIRDVIHIQHLSYDVKGLRVQVKIPPKVKWNVCIIFFS